MAGDAPESRHPVNVAHLDNAPFGERLADRAAAGIGSWRFLILQTIAVACWVGLNVVGLVRRWDPFPFILLNLLFSVQAAYTGPVLLLAGNRQAQKDRATLEHSAAETAAIAAAMVALLRNTPSDTAAIEQQLLGLVDVYG